MKGKAGIFIEYLWLLISAVSLFAALQQWYKNDIKNSSVFLVMLLVSLLMYTLRKQVRKKNKTNQDEK